jgi:hypothetical protein
VTEIRNFLGIGAPFITHNRGPNSRLWGIHRTLMQYGSDLPAHLPGITEMRRGVALQAEHQYLALPVRLALEHLHDMLPGEEPGLDAVGLPDGVMEILNGKIVHLAASMAISICSSHFGVVSYPGWAICT